MSVSSRQRALTIVVAAISVLPACQQPADRAYDRGTTVAVAYCCGRDALGPTADASARYLVFLPLTELDAIGERRPRLARHWEHSADYRESTYHLRTDIRWHDGVPATAHDVKFTLNLLSHPDVGHFSPGSIESVVLDDSTVTIRSPSGVGGVDWWEVFYPKHIVERLDPKEFYSWDFWTRPVGNGAYRLVRYVPETSMTFETVPGHPLAPLQIDRIVLRFVQDAALAELLGGGVDVISGSDPAQAARLARDPRFRVHHGTAETVVRALYWNGEHRLFRDSRLRRALTLAIDRRELLSAVGLPDTLPIADGPYTWRQLLRRDLLPPLPYDPARASVLLDSLGWRDPGGGGVRQREGVPLQFTALVRRDPIFAVVAVLVQQQLRRIGVRMDLQPMESELLLARFGRGNFEAAFLLSQHMPAWLLRHFGEGGPAGYRNSELLRLIESARETPNPDVRDAIYDELMTIFQSDVPVTFLFPQTESFFVHRRIRGLEGRRWPDPVLHAEHLHVEEG